MATPLCHGCKIPFPSWEALAKHIIEPKLRKKHSFGSRVWANKYLMRSLTRVEPPQRQSADPDRIKTLFGDENRANQKVELSGKTKPVTVVCPRCKRHYQKDVEVEYLSEEYIWRIGNDPAISCEGCLGAHHKSF